MDPDPHSSELFHPDPAPDVRTVPKNIRIRIRYTVAKYLYNNKPTCMYIDRKFNVEYDNNTGRRKMSGGSSGGLKYLETRQFVD